MGRLVGVKEVERVHLDIIDGVFADNLTVMPEDLHTIAFEDLGIDFHLMTEEPIDYIATCADLLEYSGGVRVIGQVERMGDLQEFVVTAAEAECEVGLAVNLETPVEAIEALLYKQLDCVLLMSVPVGFSGQEFDRAVLQKIERLRSRGFGGEIIVDGGMKPETIAIAEKAGATAFAVNSFLWQHEDVAEAVRKCYG